MLVFVEEPMFVLEPILEEDYIFFYPTMNELNFFIKPCFMGSASGISTVVHYENPSPLSLRSRYTVSEGNILYY